MLFRSSVDRIRNNLRQIHKFSLSSQKYSFPSRINLFSLSFTMTVWLLLGVVTPLALLAFPRATVTPVVAMAVLLGSLVFATASVMQFVRDLQERPFDWGKYLERRWYSPKGLCTKFRYLKMLLCARQLCGSGHGKEPEQCGRRCRAGYQRQHAVSGAD